MTKKYFIGAASLQEDAFKLATIIMDSDFRPTFIVGMWRGGAAIGVTVQELLAYCGCETDHISIRTSSYTGIGQRDRNIRVHCLSYLINTIRAEDSLLIVDDVFDSGLSLQEVIRQIKQRCGENTPRQIRTATLYYKPGSNEVGVEPDFYLHKSDQWLVFPHELAGLTNEDLQEHKPGISAIRQWLLKYKQ